MFIEPCSGPCECVEEHGFVCVVACVMVFVEVFSDVPEKWIQVMCGGCFRVRVHRIVFSSGVA